MFRLCVNIGYWGPQNQLGHFIFTRTVLIMTKLGLHSGRKGMVWVFVPYVFTGINMKPFYSSISVSAFSPPPPFPPIWKRPKTGQEGPQTMQEKGFKKCATRNIFSKMSLRCLRPSFPRLGGALGSTRGGKLMLRLGVNIGYWGPKTNLDISFLPELF